MTMICVTCGVGEMRRVREYVASGPVVIIGTFILIASILVGAYGVFGIMTAQPDVLAVVNRGNAIWWGLGIAFGFVVGIAALQRKWLLRCERCGVEPRPVYQAFVERGLPGAPVSPQSRRGTDAADRVPGAIGLCGRAEVVGSV